MSPPNRFQRDIDHWNETGKCLRHFSLDDPPLFCEQCGKPWKRVVDGRRGRRLRRKMQPLGHGYSPRPLWAGPCARCGAKAGEDCAVLALSLSKSGGSGGEAR